MRAIALILIATALAEHCIAQLPEEFRTMGGEHTGYYWRSMSFGEKLAYVSGFQSAYLLAAPKNKSAIDEARKACLAQFSNPTAKQNGDCIVESVKAKSAAYEAWDENDPLPGGTYAETIEATDRFFMEPENRVMSIVSVWALTKWKREGRKQIEIDALVDVMKETFIRNPRKLCELGFLMSASRCTTLGTVLKP